MQQGLGGEGGRQIGSAYVHRPQSLKPPKTTVLRNKPYAALMESALEPKATHARLMEAGLHGRAGKQNATYARLMKAGLKRRRD